jgi:hypothetical protein
MAHRDFKVNWKLKAIAYNIFDQMIFGENVYYFMQRRITHTLPRKLKPTIKAGDAPIRHMQTIIQLRDDITRLTLLEIGAGWDLYSNLIYYCMGLNNQIAIDIRRWARAETINAVINHLQSDPPPNFVRTPTKLVKQNTLEQDLLSYYGIRYLAPFDARHTGLPDASIDVITTTSVFEHVPAEACTAIFSEFRRIIRSGGLMSHGIDYSDHYSHADPNIGPFNYLKFSEKQWKILNPGIHFQNRLRTADFLKKFQDANFQIIELEEWSGTEEELNGVCIDEYFLGKSRQELLVLGCLFTLRPG